MRRHPARVRSAVLNGVAPPSLKNPLYHARESQRTIDALFDLCDSDRACHAAFPRIREEFRAVIERLEREPAAVPLTLSGAAPVTVRFSRYAFADAVRMMLYGQAGASNVPLAVHQAYLGNFSVIAQRTVDQRRSNTRLMHGMLLTTTCAEDVARITDDEIRTLTAGTFLGADRVRQQKEVCAIWPRRDGPPEDGRPVQSDSPVLLLSGTLDPVTPPLWADEALRTLPNGRHLVVPGAHGVGGPCISQIVRQFISAGSAKDLDTACTAGIRQPPFVTKM
jgi:pimeloyl-ACP methyl ester carboxylesterase